MPLEKHRRLARSHFAAGFLLLPCGWAIFGAAVVKGCSCFASSRATPAARAAPADANFTLRGTPFPTPNQAEGELQVCAGGGSAPVALGGCVSRVLRLLRPDCVGVCRGTSSEGECRARSAGAVRSSTSTFAGFGEPGAA
eukprot:CAMPEP_0174367828 /NCGR_PEP_ID=MMETSP0811_2-20130205/86845_1 /TAXON_ID=73025 ORGANISM="Eutreptiella gymnastica-like, Strain CCMP1594" /NCGR_SAMPLE_ID=MMETSP0811_2 /ASSEMBLY_ACC=CAM_ASM_000667 /LENGTH=139 /DNA_ID=CAMNT_0015510787 /DNA_START=881 /DNA_END=1296 /DNA_ORIENTATION=-